MNTNTALLKTLSFYFQLKKITETQMVRLHGHNKKTLNITNMPISMTINNLFYNILEKAF